MMSRKSLSLLLTFMMIIGIITVMPMQASAEDVDIADTGACEELADTGAQAELADEAADMEMAETGSGMSLQGLMKKFPEGAYWNHQVKKKTDDYIDSNNNPDGYSWTPCYSHSEVTPVGKYTCNCFDYGIQCYGFALKLSYDVYGSDFDEWNTVSYKKCKPGDVITYTHRSVYSGTVNSHTFMVIGRDGDTIRIGECNFDRHCQITWSRYADISSYDNTSAVCYSAPRALPSYTLDTPEMVSSRNTQNGIAVSWKAVDGAAKYRVYYKGGSAASWKALANTVKTNYTFTNPVYNTKYTFTVRAIDTDGAVASDYDPAGRYVVFKCAPSVTAAAADGRIGLTWNAVPLAAKYRVYVKGGQYAKYTRLTDTANTACNFNAGVSGTSYYSFIVRAINSSNQFCSDASAAVSAKFTRTLATPTDLKAAAITTQGAVKISWTAVKNATRYQVFAKRTGIDANWKRIGVATTNYFIQKACASNTEYTYTVRCIEANGTYISGYDKTGVTLHYFSIPANIKAAKQDNKGNIKVTWGRVPGAAYYTVYYKGASVKSWRKLGVVDTNSYLFKNAKSGTKYTFTVRACDDAGKLLSSYDPVGCALTY